MGLSLFPNFLPESRDCSDPDLAQKQPPSKKKNHLKRKISIFHPNFPTHPKPFPAQAVGSGTDPKKHLGTLKNNNKKRIFFFLGSL